MPRTKRGILALLAVLGGAGLAAMAGLDLASPAEETQRALTALSEGNWALAERIAAAAVQANRDQSWRAWLIVGAARQRMGRHEEAARAYREFLSMGPRPAERGYAIASIRHCQRAGRHRERFGPVSRRLSAEQRKGLARVDERTYMQSSDHFLVRANNDELAALVATQAEAALRRICDTLLSGQTFPHAVDVNIWPDVKQYATHATSAAEWAGGSYSIERDDSGQIVRRIDLTQLDANGQFDTDMLDRVLPHEMCHLVLAEYFGDAHCPLAVNEGLAMMAEATVDNGRVRMAGVALLGTQRIALGDLLRLEQCDKNNAQVFYAESFSFTSYLHARLTGEQFREMLAHVKAGMALDQAIQRALYVPPDERFLGRLARAWETEAARQTQFLEALDTKLAGAT